MPEGQLSNRPQLPFDSPESYEPESGLPVWNETRKKMSNFHDFKL